jgi:transposase
MFNAPKSLPSDPGELRVAAESLVELAKAQALEIEKLKHQLAGHNRHRFGSKSESADQLNLQLRLEEEETAAASITAEEDASAAPEPKQKPKRKPLPPELPRNEQVLSPGEVCKCGGELRAIGEDVTEELEYVPGRFIVNRIVRLRVACKCCDKIVQAALPSRPIERGRPGAGLLAHVLVSKYADHCPLYRQSQIMERDGIDLDRSTLAGWVDQSTRLLEPLAEAIGRHVRAGAAIFADDTPIKMQAKRSAQQRASGPMSAMNGPGIVKRHRRHGTSSAQIGKADIPPDIWPTTKVGYTRMATPGSTISSPKRAFMRWPAWRMSGASLLTSSSLRDHRFLKRRSAGSHFSMPWKRQHVVSYRKNALPCGSKTPSPCSTNWKPG